MPDLVEWRPGTLRGTRDLAPDVRLFEIDAPPGFGSPPPGGHVQFLLPIAGQSEVRSYSTLGGWTDGLCRIAVKALNPSRGGSATMWQLKPGARLTMSGPRNRFTLARDRPDYLLVAGGIGITPLYGMALALAEMGARFRLIYAVRRAEDAVLAQELRERIGHRLRLVVGTRVDFDAEAAMLQPGGEMYVCGPIGMLEAAKRAWRGSSHRVEGLRFETFGNSGRTPAERFTVRIPRLDVSFDVPESVTLLDALEQAGVAMIHDCRRGECGLCALPILAADGVVDHRDVFFSDTEKAGNGKLCTCVSRLAGGVLTLDTGDRPG